MDRKLDTPLTTAREQLTKISALDILHGDVQRVTVLPKFKNACDVAVLKMRSDPRFIDEHFDEVFILHDVREDALERQDPLKPVHAKGLSLKHLGHSADVDPLKK